MDRDLAFGTLPHAESQLQVVTTPPFNRPTSINLLITATDGHTFRESYVAGERFLSVMERVRAHGLPQELRTKSPVLAGTCKAWQGTSAGGLHTLAFAHGSISIILTSNSLSRNDLVSYAARTMCT
jgi:hypothetical protein